jgi:hypothetical protein
MARACERSRWRILVAIVWNKLQRGAIAWVCVLCACSHPRISSTTAGRHAIATTHRPSALDASQATDATAQAATPSSRPSRGAARDASAADPLDASSDAQAAAIDEDGGGSAAGLVFVDVTVAAGLSYRQAPVHGLNETDPDWYSDHQLAGDAPFLTGGATAGDFDADGFTDLYVTRLDQPGILFRNRGDGHFEDVTSAVGLDVAGFRSVGAAFVDVDNDGDLDLYVTTLGGSAYLLFVNQGGSFSEQAAARRAALADSQARQGFSVSVGDYDRDGWLDLHTTEWQLGVSPKANPSHARLLHNRGAAGAALAGFFEEVTASAGVVIDNPPVSSSGPLSFSSSFSDLDDDGWPELVVASDFGSSRLFWNHGDGTFGDGTAAAGVGTDQNGMGMTIGDYDGDGLLDWFVTAIYCDHQTIDTVFCGGNRLYRNNGDRTFRDDTDLAGVRAGGWGWGANLFDYDNDGDLDLAMTNGVRFRGPDYRGYFTDPTHLWRNDGAGPMVEVSRATQLIDNGDGKGLLTLDYDNDGDLDLFVVNHVLGGRLYRNDGGNTQDYLRVALQGVTANRQGIGARVRVKVRADSPAQVRELRGGSNFLSQDEPVLHFGLAEGSAPIAEVQITWPTPGARKVQVLHDVARNQLLRVQEPN